MAKVAKKPLEPRDEARTSIAEVKPRKKRKASCQPKPSSSKKTLCNSRRRQRLGKIVRKGKRTLPKTTRRKVSKKNIKFRIAKEPSETALALLIQERMSGDASLNAPAQSQPSLESARICADETSALAQSVDEDLRNINV
ncbi:hypothetical protein NN561_012172 [Cricetulus griseus]